EIVKTVEVRHFKREARRERPAPAPAPGGGRAQPSRGPPTATRREPAPRAAGPPGRAPKTGPPTDAGPRLPPRPVAAARTAAVGGKTGINTSEGKSLVGAFHPPIAVVADLDVLGGLGANDVAAGLAEAVKAGFIEDARILELVEQDPAAVLDVTSEQFREVVE